MKRLKFSPRALTDLADIREYIAKDSLASAKRVVGLVVATLSRLKLFPHSGRRGRIEGTYELIVPRVPFIVVYTIRKDTVEVLAIVHVMRSDKNRLIK